MQKNLSKASQEASPVILLVHVAGVPAPNWCLEHGKCASYRLQNQWQLQAATGGKQLHG